MADFKITDEAREIVRESCFQIDGLMDMLTNFVANAGSSEASHVRAVAGRIRSLTLAVYDVVESEGVDGKDVVFPDRVSSTEAWR